MDKVSIIIPSRNEPYLNKTIEDVLKKATGDIEVIAVLDGYWPDDIIEDSRVHYIHFTNPKGMRNAISSGVNIALGEYILKTDAHCLFSDGFDEELKKHCEHNWVVVPRRYALDPEKWEIEKRTDDKYPIDYCYLDKNLHAVEWREKNRNPEFEKNKIDDLMSSQGSCWFMRRDYFERLELMDEETYGTFWSEFQEIGLKCWLSAGRVVINKNAYYAHWHKTKSRGYSLPPGEKEQTQAMVEKWRAGKFWKKQTKELSYLIDKFKPVPTWE